MKNCVLLVGNFLSEKQGSRGVCEDLAIKLTDDGWNVITTSDKKSRMFRLLDMLQTTWSHRHQYNIALVDVYSGAAFTWADLVCRVLRYLHKPYMLTLHGGNLPTFAIDHSYRVKKLLESASVVTTPSNYLLEHMRSYRNDIQLVPNPLDLDKYKFKNIQSNIQPKLIWLRAFHDVYNPDLAIKVIAELSSSVPDVELIMVGPDKGDGSLQRCQQLANKLSVQKHIQFIGGVPKTAVPHWLAKGDIFINTTNIDNTPVSVIEAMACGLCVVSTNVGGIPYLLNHEQDSLLVSPTEPEAMANAIRRILTEPALVDRLSRNAHAKAKQFDWTVILPQWESLLTKVIRESEL